MLPVPGCALPPGEGLELVRACADLAARSGLPAYVPPRSAAEEGRLRFLPRTDAALEQAVLDESPLPGCEFVSRLGDPGLLHCVVFRHEQKPGGVFVVEDDNGLLFAAVAETNLAYAMALGRLGKMISYARYSADIFAENMLDDDD